MLGVLSVKNLFIFYFLFFQLLFRCNYFDDNALSALGANLANNFESLQSLSLEFSRAIYGPLGISSGGFELLLISISIGLESLKDLTLNFRR